jgi:hypothetical protein
MVFLLDPETGSKITPDRDDFKPGRIAGAAAFPGGRRETRENRRFYE